MNTKTIGKTLLLSSMALFATTARAQETEAAAASKLAGIALPNGAVRIVPRSVPGELTQALSTMMKAGGPQVRRGATEVLAWTGGNYKLARAGQYKTQIGAKLKAAGWQYEEGEKIEGADGLTMVSALKTAPSRKALIGFWAPTKDALVLAWTEMLPANSNSNSNSETPAETDINTPTPSPDAPSAAQTFEVAPNGGVVNVMKGVTPKLPTFSKLAAKAGFVRGYVKDASGKPLEGAVIGVRSSAAGGFYSGAQGKTDARGYYEIQVPWGAAEFYCAGYSVDFYDERAALGLHPADGEASAFASAQGAVENWVLLMHGIADRDGASENPGYINNYYGGGLNIGYYVADPRFDGDSGLPAGSEIDLTLIPDGPLLDGSKGRTFIFTQRVQDGVGRGFKIVNLPVGRYRVVAWLKQDGKPSPLKLKETGPYGNRPFGLEPKQAAQSAKVLFRPQGATAGKVVAAHGNWNSVDITLSR
ncbi:MAG TPA: hypothetical protein VF627_11280 [Abditibacterium sp.]|jgi:hypothetical protein